MQFSGCASLASCHDRQVNRLSCAAARRPSRSSGARSPPQLGWPATAQQHITKLVEHAPRSLTPEQPADREERMAKMPSRLCRWAADRGPSRVGNAALDSRPHSCSNRLDRSML